MPPYDWIFDAANASGTYAYSVGDKCDDGTVNLRINNDGTVRYRIIGLTGAPFYRTACFPEDALSSSLMINTRLDSPAMENASMIIPGLALE